MATAMDDLNLVLMLVEGITPEEAAIRREKQREEEELKAQEASRSKAIEWMKTMDLGSLYIVVFVVAVCSFVFLMFFTFCLILDTLDRLRSAACRCKSASLSVECLRFAREWRILSFLR